MKLKRYEAEKVVAFLSVCFAVGIGLYMFGMYCINNDVEKIDVSDLKRFSEGKLEYGVKEIRDDLDYVSVTGYIYEPGVSSSEVLVETDLLACDDDTGQYYKLPTENILSTDITEQVNDGCDYSYAGFKSVSYKKDLPVNYHFALLYESNGEKILVDEGKEE